MERPASGRRLCAAAAVRWSWAAPRRNRARGRSVNLDVPLPHFKAVPAVCPVNDPAIAQLAILNASGDSGTSQFVANLQPAHVVVDYLDENHAVVADPASTAGFLQIRFVRTRIEDFTYQVTLPVIAGLSTFDMPPFTYVLPRESLGVPREGAITDC